MKTEIYNYLKQSNLPVKRSILLDHLIKKGFEITDRKLRSTVEGMISEDFFLIESSEKGYSVIKTEEELARAKAYLQNKIESMCVRRNCLERNWAKAQEAKNEPILKGDQFLMFG